MKNKNRLNKIIQSAGGKIVGVEIGGRTILRYWKKPYKMSAKIVAETNSYVTFKPLSGLCRGETKVHKNSIEKLVVSGVEYNK